MVNLAFFFVLSALVLFEGFARVSGRPSGPVVAWIWTVVGIILLILAILIASGNGIIKFE